jgi:hypothetical protein
MVPATVISLEGACFAVHPDAVASDRDDLPSCADELLVTIPQTKNRGNKERKSFLLGIWQSSRFFFLHVDPNR